MLDSKIRTMNAPRWEGSNGEGFGDFASETICGTRRYGDVAASTCRTPPPMRLQITLLLALMSSAVARAADPLAVAYGNEERFLFNAPAQAQRYDPKARNGWSP